ncbi:MAG: hypothetical protein PVH84_04645 [Candidatus Aminicenantes bacterium]
MKRFVQIGSVLLVAIGLCVSAETVLLNDFTEVFKALESGERVKAVFHYKDCRLTIDGEDIEKVPDAVGGMAVDTFEYFGPGAIGNEKAYIASSHTVLIHHPRHGYVLNYVKVSIFEDNTVKVSAKYVTPDTYETRMDEVFSTEIHNGKNSGGARFYLIK